MPSAILFKYTRLNKRQSTFLPRWQTSLSKPITRQMAEACLTCSLYGCDRSMFCYVTIRQKTCHLRLKACHSNIMNRVGYFDGIIQGHGISIANALEIPQSAINLRFVDCSVCDQWHSLFSWITGSWTPLMRLSFRCDLYHESNVYASSKTPIMSCIPKAATLKFRNG